MIYAIIAAGEGSRLSEEGLTGPKPMAMVNGEMLIDRLIRIFLDNQASSIRIIINDHSEKLRDHLERLDLPVPLQLIVKSTPSSFHSFYALMQANKEIPEDLCLTTTDTIFGEAEFAQFIHVFQANRHNDGLLAVTSFVDDESPLYIDFDATYRITAITDTAGAQEPFVSGGIYCLRKPALAKVAAAYAKGINRMRNFQRSLLTAHLHLQAHPFSKMVDVDHITDIEKAEIFLKEAATPKILQQVNG